MADVSRSRRMAADPESIWALLADFGALSRWADGIDHSCLLNAEKAGHGVGLARRVQADRDAVVETITVFDAPRHLAYEIAGLPRGFAVTNRWDLRPDRDGTTTVTLTSTVTTDRRLLRSVAERTLAALLARRSDALLHSLDRALGGQP